MAGEEGVSHVLQLLRDEIDVSMSLCGCREIQDIDPSLLVQTIRT
jgi:isopentenyl diphosphate isomerase/L-lactate dehydrogenase-like FMN-dependent dehydrogenase